MHRAPVINTHFCQVHGHVNKAQSSSTNNRSLAHSRNNGRNRSDCPRYGDADLAASNEAAASSCPLRQSSLHRVGGGHDRGESSLRQRLPGELDPERRPGLPVSPRRVHGSCRHLQPRGTRHGGQHRAHGTHPDQATAQKVRSTSSLVAPLSSQPLDVKQPSLPRGLHSAHALAPPWGEWVGHYPMSPTHGFNTKGITKRRAGTMHGYRARPSECDNNEQ
jgi:hypothetical protein